MCGNIASVLATFQFPPCLKKEANVFGYWLFPSGLKQITDCDFDFSGPQKIYFEALI